MSLPQAKEALAMAMDIKTVSEGHDHHAYTPEEVISHDLNAEFCCETPSASRLRILLAVKDRLHTKAVDGESGAMLWEDQFERAVHIIHA